MITIAVVITIMIMIAVMIVLTFADFTFANIAVVFMLTKISFALSGPGVVVVYAAVFSIPVAVEESLSVVTGCDPVSAGIGWPSPISLIPAVVPSHGVPVTLHPNKIRPRTGRPNRDDAGRRGWTNSDSDRDLSKDGQGKE
jgi:hypothetical protein